MTSNVTSKVTGRLDTSDLWHLVSVGDQGVTLICTGRNVQRGRVMLDRSGTNVTCLRCQRVRLIDGT